MKNILIKIRFITYQLLRNISYRNFWIMLIGDCLAVAMSMLIAYFIRFEFSLNAEHWSQLLAIIPLALLCRIPVFYAFKLYSGMWRYTSIVDLINILKGVIISSLILTAFLLYQNRFVGYSRAVLLIDSILLLFFISGSRVLIRWLLKEGGGRRNKNKSRDKKLLIIGAGSAGEKVVREIKDNFNVSYLIVGFVDDDPKKWGLKIHGFPILGGTEQLVEIAKLTQAEEILLAIPSAVGNDVRRIIMQCRGTALPFKVLPSIGEIIQGKETASSMRDVHYRDLLRRPIVQLNHEEIDEYVGGKVILVTGAGGSIGSELCRQIIRFKPKHLVLFDAGEENLYRIQMEMEHDIRFPHYTAVLGNCTNQKLLEKIFHEHHPTVVFHAAAYKHVPLVETNPWEGVINNVVAFKTLFEVASSKTVEKFVLVSSDKAVRPTNIMGATKRLTELIMHSYCDKQRNCQNQGDMMACMAVRFGNVLGSSGSVIPLFRQQIEKGGPVTVTDPEVNRFFMAIEEAAQLILQSGAMGCEGEIFLLEMGEPVFIKDLAEDLILLMGYTPYEDIDIIYTGLRPGEKLYEELITEGEGIVKTRHEKIMMLKRDSEIPNTFGDQLEEIVAAAKDQDGVKIKKMISDVLPEYLKCNDNN